MLTNREKQLSYVVRVRILKVMKARNYEKNNKMNLDSFKHSTTTDTHLVHQEVEVTVNVTTDYYLLGIRKLE